MSPWPGAFTTARGKTLKVHATRVAELTTPSSPGTVVLADKSRVVVACADRAIEFVRVQVEGKRPITAGEWVAGRGVAEGDLLGPDTA